MKRRKPLKRGRELRADPEKVREFMQRGRYASKQRGKRIATCARPGCGKQFERYASDLARGAKYCSRECFRLDREGRSAANKRGAAQSPAIRAMATTRTGEGNPNYRHGKRSGAHSRERTERFKSGQERCVHPDCNTPQARAHEHHVVYEQHVRHEGGDIYDPRNALRLCVGCHSSHHRRGSRIVPLSALRDENYEFAFELLGAAAELYLRRRYSGEDPRLAAWVSRVAVAAANSGDETRGGSDGGR